MRRLGGLVNFLPFTYTAILIGSLSLMAFPFLTGFYSKDLILELALGQYEVSGSIAYWMGTISAVLTAFYSARLIRLVFFTTPNAPKNDYLHTHEAPMLIVVPLVVLSVLSIVFGYVAKDRFVGIGSDFLSTPLYQLPNHVTLVEAEFGLPLGLKLLPMLGSFFGFGLAIYLYHIAPVLTIRLSNSNALCRSVYKFLNGKWLFDNVYNSYIISGGLELGHNIAKVIDRGIVELVGPFGLTNSLMNTGRKIREFDTGIITTYALYIMVGLIRSISLLFAPIFFGDRLESVLGGDIVMILLLFCTIVLLPYVNRNN